MKLPVRKCYYVAKVSFILLLVVFILGLFEHWRGGKKTVEAQTEEEEFERKIQEDERRIIPGLGEGGVAAHLVGEAKRLGEESEKKLAINVYLSDRIPYNRTLNDHRNPACKRVLYDAELPSASVILIFHNEPYSVVIRTIWSVVNSVRRDQPWYQRANFIDRNTGAKMTLGYPGQDPSSPLVYLKELILVDDNSTLPELKGKLSHYIRTRLPPDLIKILRLPERVGLTRARLAGARYASGDVLVFLDAHCEADHDWLRPLLQRVGESPRSVVVPIIDVIEASNFYYSVQDPVVFQVGGFTFMGHFTWIDVPDWEKERRGSDIAPTWSPTMAGGLFAIRRQYFWELGAYDEQMAGWGGENLEMSFRIWQCGGTLETIPCSRVGHVFRAFHPYGLPAHTDTHGINTARMAEVWMDEYAELFYLHRPDLRNNPKIGDVTHRRILREKLKCKSFEWYLKHVYRDKFVPVRDVYGYGRFRNPSSGLCLDSLQREGEAAALGAYPCHARLEGTQYWALSHRGHLRDEDRCAELHYRRRAADDSDTSRRVLMVTCHGKQRGQKWRYLPSKQLVHVQSGLCLTAPAEAGADVIATRCTNDRTQIWHIDYNEENDFRLDGNAEPSEQELRLQKLRGQRRISRSLLSYNTTDQRRHHKKKKSKSRKNKKKDKFILKVLRGANSSEHVEAEVWCAHRRLLPNDTLVRDIVRALNDKDIKVINNGRLFEKHRVVELRPRNHKHHHAHKQHQKDTQKKKKQKKQDVQPVNIDTNINPNTDSPNKHIPESFPDKNDPEIFPDKNDPGNIMRLNQEHPKKIIIEDFVEVTQKPVTDTTKRKRKRTHKKLVPVFAPFSPDTLKPISLEDSPLDETQFTNRVERVKTPTILQRRQSPNDKQKEDSQEIYKRYDETDDDTDDNDEVYKAKDPKQLNEDNLNDQHGDDDEKYTNNIKSDNEAYKSKDPKTLNKNFNPQNDNDEYKNNYIKNDKIEVILDDVKKPRRNKNKDSEEIFEDNDLKHKDRNNYEISSENESKYNKIRYQLVNSDKMTKNDVKVTNDRYKVFDKVLPKKRDDKVVYTDRSKVSSGEGVDVKFDDISTKNDESSPVRVLVRSNVTLHLGDELFRWRHTADDVANLLGELTIPSNSTAPTSSEFESRQDTVVTGHGRKHESSSSGDTSEEK